MARRPRLLKGDGQLTRRAFLRRGLWQSGVLGGTLILAKTVWLPSVISRAAGPAVSGEVLDLLTDAPIGAADVRVSGGLGATITDAAGHFDLALPAGSYELQITRPGYLDVARTVFVGDAGANAGRFTLLPVDPSPLDQQAIYDKIIARPEWPEANAPFSPIVTEVSAQGVVVPDTIPVRWPDGTQTTMPLEEYLRHVVPAEMPANWHPEALKAQAVAARTYAVAYVQSRGYICSWTSCQYYGPDTYATTDQAVAATRGQVATYNGNIISAVYFAQCDGAATRNSEQAWSSASYKVACAVGGWSYSPYLRAQPCSGHARYAYNDCGFHGHGVGMCQWGAAGLGGKGLTHDQILGRYYTGIQILRSAPRLSSPADGVLQLVGVPLTLQWIGGSDRYQVTIRSANGQTRTSDWLSSLTYAPSLPAGRYDWSVNGQTGNASDGQTATWRFTLADKIYAQSLPQIMRK